MERNEHLRSREQLPAKQTERSSPEFFLEVSQVDTLYARRKEMLVYIAQDIGPAFCEILAEKIQREREFLMAILERDARVIEVRKKSMESNKSMRILDPSLFVKKPLDTTHL
jgi:hypothetical protein